MVITMLRLLWLLSTTSSILLPDVIGELSDCELHVLTIVLKGCTRCRSREPHRQQLLHRGNTEGAGATYTVARKAARELKCVCLHAPLGAAAAAAAAVDLKRRRV